MLPTRRRPMNPRRRSSLGHWDAPASSRLDRSTADPHQNAVNFRERARASFAPLSRAPECLPALHRARGAPGVTSFLVRDLNFYVYFIKVWMIPEGLPS